MNKLSCLAAIAVTIGFAMVSCEEELGKYGDPSISSQIELLSVTSLVSGETFDFQVVGERDTVYLYQHVTTDTLRDANGDYVIGSTGNYETTNDTTYLPGTGRITTGHIIELSQIVKTWTADQDGTADTLRLKIKSNARWKLLTATILSTSGADYSSTNDSKRYFASCNATEQGGGDGHIDIEMNYFSGNRITVIQPVMTNDSATMYMINMQIRGKNYK